MKSFAVAVVIALLVAPALAQKPEQDSGNAQLVATGRITKIDLKKKTFTLRSEVDLNTGRPAARGGERGGSPDGRSGSGGQRDGGSGREGRSGNAGGITLPGGIGVGTGGGSRGGRGGPSTGGGAGGGGNRGDAAPQGQEYKITVTDKTLIGDGDMKIPFNLLKVGDEVSVSGLPKGGMTKLEATAVSLSK